MTADERKRHGLAWLRRAEKNHRSATQGVFPEDTCFFAQQSAKKALKAGLIFEGVRFPYGHDLDQLRDLLPPTWSVKKTHPELGSLAKWAVVSRYPDADDPELYPTKAQATASLKISTEVVESVKADLDARSKALDRGGKGR